MFNTFIGKRCLLILAGRYHGPHMDAVSEFKIIEISPSGKWVKLMNLNGMKFWRNVDTVKFIEELKDLKVGKPDD